MLLSFTSCVKPPDMDGILDSVLGTQTLQEQVAESIGQYENKEIWTHGGFQDYTDYGIYSYTSANLNNNQYLKPVTRMAELGLAEEDYWWYLNLRKYGGTKHAGFGLGFERIIMYLTGVSNIRDVIPYPRTVGNAEY